VIGRTPRGLSDRVIKLEAKRKPVHGSELFVIWGKDAADLESKIKKAKTTGDLKSGDRCSAHIWPRSSKMPPSRRTSLLAMFKSNMNDHELEAWFEARGLVRGREAPEGPRHPSPDSLNFSSEQLCEIIASELPRAE
jgi:hypothetical protein